MGELKVKLRQPKLLLKLWKGLVMQSLRLEELMLPKKLLLNLRTQEILPTYRQAQGGEEANPLVDPASCLVLTNNSLGLMVNIEVFFNSNMILYRSEIVYYLHIFRIAVTLIKSVVRK